MPGAHPVRLSVCSETHATPRTIAIHGPPHPCVKLPRPNTPCAAAVASSPRTPAATLAADTATCHDAATVVSCAFHHYCSGSGDSAGCVPVGLDDVRRQHGRGGPRFVFDGVVRVQLLHADVHGRCCGVSERLSPTDDQKHGGSPTQSIVPGGQHDRARCVRRRAGGSAGHAPGWLMARTLQLVGQRGHCSDGSIFATAAVSWRTLSSLPHGCIPCG